MRVASGFEVGGELLYKGLATSRRKKSLTTTPRVPAPGLLMATRRPRATSERSRAVSTQGNWMHSGQSQAVLGEEPDAHTEQWQAFWSPRKVQTTVRGNTSLRGASLPKEPQTRALEPQWFEPIRPE